MFEQLPSLAETPGTVDATDDVEAAHAGGEWDSPVAR
jgi:hypothetical protein